LLQAQSINDANCRPLHSRKHRGASQHWLFPTIPGRGSKQYCAIRNISIHKIIIEDFSAKTFKRPEWIKWFNELKTQKHPKIDLLLFTKWDRFNRNTSDAYYMISTLKKLGIEAHAIEQPLDLSVPENRMTLAIYLAVSEVENARRYSILNRECDVLKRKGNGSA